MSVRYGAASGRRQRRSRGAGGKAAGKLRQMHKARWGPSCECRRWQDGRAASALADSADRTAIRGFALAADGAVEPNLERLTSNRLRQRPRCLADDDQRGKQRNEPFHKGGFVANADLVTVLDGRAIVIGEVSSGMDRAGSVAAKAAR